MRFNLLIRPTLSIQPAELATADDCLRFPHAASHLADVWAYVPGNPRQRRGVAVVP